MWNGKYRTVVAAVLAGAILSSPLLCGMSCVESRSGKSSALVEAAPGMGELAEAFVKSGFVGCVLMDVVLNTGFDEWIDSVEFRNWVWVGAELLRFVRIVRFVVEVPRSKK